MAQRIGPRGGNKITPSVREAFVFQVYETVEVVNMEVRRFVHLPIRETCSVHEPSAFVSLRVARKSCRFGSASLPSSLGASVVICIIGGWALMPSITISLLCRRSKTTEIDQSWAPHADTVYLFRPAKLPKPPKSRVRVPPCQEADGGYQRKTSDSVFVTPAHLMATTIQDAPEQHRCRKLFHDFAKARHPIPLGRGCI